MAKNWKPGEAAVAIKEGKKEDILDIGRRFPLFLNKASQLNEAGIDLLHALPEYVTARKMESMLKGDVEETEAETEAEEAEAEEVKPAKKEKAPKEAAPAKTEKKAKKVEPKEEAEEDEAEEEEPEQPKESAKELYLKAKKLGLEVEPKKDAAYYKAAIDKEEAKRAKEARKKEAIKPEEKKSKKSDDEDWDI